MGTAGFQDRERSRRDLCLLGRAGPERSPPRTLPDSCREVQPKRGASEANDPVLWLDGVDINAPLSPYPTATKERNGNLYLISYSI